MSLSQITLTAVLMALAYVLGSVPFSYLVARANGVDLRTVGSGNVGGAKSLISVGESPSPDQIAPVELAAWTSVIQTLLGFDECITKR